MNGEWCWRWSCHLILVSFRGCCSVCSRVREAISLSFFFRFDFLCLRVGGRGILRVIDCNELLLYLSARSGKQPSRPRAFVVMLLLLTLWWFFISLVLK